MLILRRTKMAQNTIPFQLFLHSVGCVCVLFGFITLSLSLHTLHLPCHAMPFLVFIQLFIIIIVIYACQLHSFMHILGRQFHLKENVLSVCVYSSSAAATVDFCVISIDTWIDLFVCWHTLLQTQWYATFSLTFFFIV